MISIRNVRISNVYNLGNDERTMGMLKSRKD